MKPFLSTTTAVLLATSLIATVAYALYSVTVWWAIGAWLFFFLHVMRVRFYFQNMPQGRDEYFISSLMQKHYTMDFCMYLLLAFIHAAFGQVVWQGFYGGTAFFLSWFTSELLEFLMIYIRYRETAPNPRTLE